MIKDVTIKKLKGGTYRKIYEDLGKNAITNFILHFLFQFVVVKILVRM
jgi:hypothetical protein